MAISNDYADLVDLSTRQVFGTIEITAGKNPNGSWNTNDVQAFMDLAGGSVPFTSAVIALVIFFISVNSADVMFPAFPLFLQTNPVIAGALLNPVLRWQQGGGYQNAWAAHDIGTSPYKSAAHSVSLIQTFPRHTVPRCCGKYHG